MGEVKIGSDYRHTNGLVYKVLYITNTAHESDTHHPDVVYMGNNGNVWSRPLSEWFESFNII